MNLALFDDALTVYGGTDEYDVVAQASGPAGVNVLPLRHLRIRFDAADPLLMCGLDVSASISIKTLGYFIGLDRAEQVLERRPTPSMRSRNIDALQPTPRSLRTGGREVISDLSFAAALHSHSEDTALSDLTRAAAALELAVTCSRLDDFGVPGLNDTRSDAVSRAAEMLRASGDEIDTLVEDAPDLARRLVQLCRAMGLSDRVFARTAEYVEQALRPDDDWYEFGADASRANMALSSMPDTPMLAARMAAPHERARSVSDLHLVQPAVELLRGGRLVVRPENERITSDACWVRVLRGGTLSVLALAPARRVAGGWLAEALVEPGLTLDDLEIDVVERPVLPESSLTRARRAVALGREAVALAVLDESPAARDLWRECAYAWDELGDRQRSRRAMAYAQSSMPQRTAALAEYIAYASDL